VTQQRSHATVAETHINVDVLESNPGFVRDIDMFCEQPAANSVLDVAADGRLVLFSFECLSTKVIFTRRGQILLLHIFKFQRR
jgi:hypothetical protein